MACSLFVSWSNFSMGDSARAVPWLELFVHVGISQELMLFIVPGKDLSALVVGTFIDNPGGDGGLLILLQMDCSASVLSSTAL